MKLLLVVGYVIITLLQNAECANERILKIDQ